MGCTRHWMGSTHAMLHWWDGTHPPLDGSTRTLDGQHVDTATATLDEWLQQYIKSKPFWMIRVNTSYVLHSVMLEPQLTLFKKPSHQASVTSTEQWPMVVVTQIPTQCKQGQPYRYYVHIPISTAWHLRQTKKGLYLLVSYKINW